MQEEMKEVGDSVHTGEKNLMPSMLKRRVGKNTVASVDGECSRVRTETSCPAAKNKLGKERDTGPHKEEFKREFGKKNTRDNTRKGKERERRVNEATNKSMKDYERCSARRVIERKQARRRAGSVAISVALPPLPSLVPSAAPLPPTYTHVHAARSVYVDHAHV